MRPLTPLREIATDNDFTAGDIFILFGELFGRGYANGLIDAAKEKGMQIIGITVGRRDENNQLRKLNSEELIEVEERLGGKIINIPMEAGFDHEQSKAGISPVGQLSKVKPTDWENFKLDWKQIEESKISGEKRFNTNLSLVIEELKSLIPEGKNVIFAHTMAGGIPRARILMPIANKVFKGRGKRHFSSEAYWNSDIGKLCAMSFDEVTAKTFKSLLLASKPIVDKIENTGKKVRFSAYGYHGTEVIIKDELVWQTYVPYKQGAAKMLLEDFSEDALSNNTKSVVFNCPEIRTNSSDIFAGVELSLFPLIKSLEKILPQTQYQKIYKKCEDKLIEGTSLIDILDKIEGYYGNPDIQTSQSFESWPTDNNLKQAEICIGLSEEIVSLHKDKKDLITDYFSTLIVEATGYIMFQELSTPSKPVLWIGHDVISKYIKLKAIV